MEHFDIQNLIFSHAAAKGKLSLDGVSLRIRAGEFLVLCGRSGSGKTTLLRHLKTVLTPNGKRSGEILFCGTPLAQVSGRDQAAKIGFVMQNPDDQIFHATVEEEVRFGPKNMKLSEEEEDRRVEDALKITGMDIYRGENPMNLPLSVRKFVTIAAVISMGTEILIFDEPTAGQDIDGNRRLSQILKTMQARGKTIITISHDMEFVAENFDRVIIMAKKKVIKEGTPEEIFWDLEALDYAMLKQPYVSRVCKALGIEKKIIHIDDAVDEIMRKLG